MLELAAKAVRVTQGVPAEQAFDIPRQLELDTGRAVVIALAGAGRGLHFVGKRIHLLRAEVAAGAHRAVACHGCCHILQPPLQRQCQAVLGQVVGDARRWDGSPKLTRRGAIIRLSVSPLPDFASQTLLGHSARAGLPALEFPNLPRPC